MNETYELKYHRIEEKYWWFIARRDMIFRLIKHLNIRKNSKILDIGCSGGRLIKCLGLKGFRNIYGIDISQKAINLCKKNGMKNVFIMDCAKTNFSNETFDIIIASDILEHIKNDASALAEWGRIMKPGGKLIIFVPASDLLWSEHDELSHHYRRYTKSQLITALKKFNFNVLKSSYWNCSLFFPMVIFKSLQHIFLKKKNKKSDHLYELNIIISKMLLILLKFENSALEYLNFPFGTSIFALAVKTK